MGRIIVMGASAGGIDAMQTLFQGLPDDFRIPILVVLHIGKGIHSKVPFLFNRDHSDSVIFGTDKMDIEAGRIYMAPPDYHMLLEKGRCLCLSVDSRIHYSRPSVDVLFESAAYAEAEQVVGVLLTGANEDGAEGLLKIKEYGGVTIVQDPVTAEMSVMPQAALNLFSPDLVAPISGILDKILELNELELG